LFVTQLSGNAGSSVWLIVWATTDCFFHERYTGWSSLCASDDYIRQVHRENWSLCILYDDAIYLWVLIMLPSLRLHYWGGS